VDETAVTLPFADGEYTFYLPLIRVAAFKREAGCSPYELFFWLGQALGRIGEEIVLSGPSPADPEQCIHLIRNALIGGGTEQTQAKKLVEQYCFPARPAIHDMALAWQILEAAVYGVKLPAKKKPAGQSRRQTRSKKAE
jgi:hypothetical protein